MSAANLITSSLDYAALDYALPPFALIKGEVRRTEGYVVVVRLLPIDIDVTTYHFDDIEGAYSVRHEQRVNRTEILMVFVRHTVLSRESAEALFADVCADLRHGGPSMRQWSEARPFQVILAKTTLKELRRRAPEWTPVLYASGPRWIRTKERPHNEPPF